MAVAYRSIALVGPRGAGKTTLGRELSRRLAWPFADGDELLATRAGMAAGDYLARAGEPAFRVLEEEVTLAALAVAPQVLALGGGAVLSPRVRAALLRADLLTAFLIAPVEHLAARLAADPVHRPALTSLSPREEIEELLRQRRSLYEEVAAIELETFPANVDSCCGLLFAKMGIRSS